MTYAVTVGGTSVHGTSQRLPRGEVKREKNAIATFSFSIYPNQAGYDTLEPLTTLAEVENSATGEVVFEGRVSKVAPDMDESGVVCKNVTCEHVMGYLRDSVQEYVEPRQWDSVAAYLDYVLGVHNSKMPTAKQIHPGTISLSTYETSDGLYKGIDRVSTWQTITDDLLDSFGGEMRVRRASDGKLYLDYTEKLGTTRSTAIELGKNMRSAAREPDPSSIITRLYPYGAKLVATVTDSSGNEYEEELEERLTIEDVNDGLLYIDDDAGISLYGIIEGVREWDDVTIEANLLSKAQAFLAENNQIIVSNRITALDLSTIGLDSDNFQLYDWYPCSNSLVGLDETLEIVKQTIDVCEPQSSSIEFGEQAISASKQYQQALIDSRKSNKFQSTANTAIKNVVSRTVSTSASIEVMEDRIVETVTETVIEETEGYVDQKVGEISVKSIESVDVWYAVSESSTVAPSDGWQTESPEIPSGQYAWSKTITTYTDGTTSESAPACITGADGRGVDNIKEQYYLSTSKETQTGGAWVDDSPAWETGTYLWTRSVVTYSDGTVEYTEPVCDSSWEAVNDVDAEVDALTGQVESTINRVVEIEKLPGSIETRFGVVEEKVTTVGSQVEIERETRETLIRESEGGIEIGKKLNGVSDPVSMQLDNDSLDFKYNGQPVAGIQVDDADSGYFYGTDVRVTQSLQLGNFAFTIRPNSNMGLVYLG